MKNFSEFRSTRRAVPDLVAAGIDAEFLNADNVEHVQAGFTYDDGTLYVEDNGAAVSMTLARDIFNVPRARLAELELVLYSWACGEYFYDAPPEDSDAAQIAVTFARVLGEWLSPEDFATMRERNARDAYSDVCHSHDYCDANEAMAQALEHEGHAVFDEEGNMIEAARVLWNAAWVMASPLLGGPIAESEPDLVAEYAAYCEAHGLPAMSADELSVILNDEQRAAHGAWLGRFITRWDAMEKERNA